MFKAISSLRPGQDESLGVPSSGMPAWHTYMALLFGGAMTLLAVLLVIPTFPRTFEPEKFLYWCVYLLLYVLSAVLINRVEEGGWTGYPLMAMLLAWLTISLSAALGLVVVGAGIAALAQARLATRLHLPTVTRLQTLSLAAGRVAINGTALIVTFSLVAAFQFNPTLDQPEWRDLFILAGVMATGALTASIVGALLLGELRDVGPRLRWGIRRGRIMLEIYTLAGVLVFGLVESEISPVLYTAILLLTVIQALRLRDSAQTEHELIQRLEELSLLNRAGEIGASTLVMDDLFDAIYQQVQQVTRAPVVYIALRGREQSMIDYRLVMAQGQRVQWPSAPLQSSAAGQLMLHQEMVQVNRHEEDLPFDQVRLTVVEQDYPLFLGLPLVVGHEALGALVVLGDPDNGLFERRIVRVLQTVARQAALAIHNAALYASSTELARHLSLINASAQTTMVKPDKHDAVQKMCETAVAIAKANAAAIFLVRGTARTATLVHAVGLSPIQLQVYSVMPPAEMGHETRLLPDSQASQDMALRRLAEQGGFRALAEIPLIINNNSLGYLMLYYREPHHFNQSEMELLQMLATQVASTIGNAELFGTLETYASEMAQLAHLSRVSTSNLDMEKVSRDVAEILCQILSVTRTTIALLDENEPTWSVIGNIVSIDGAPIHAPDDNLIKFPELAELAEQKRPQARAFHIDQSLSEPLRRLLTGYHERTVAVVPMQINNVLIGAILLGSNEKRVFTEREWQLIEMANNQIAAQIQNARLYTTTYQSLKQRLEQLAVIEEIAQQISSALDFNQIIRHMLDAALRSTGANYAALILLTEEDSGRLMVIDYTNGSFSRYMTVAGRDDIISRVIRTGETALTRDTRADRNYVAPRTGMTYLSALATPLVRDGAVIGVLNVESEQASFFTGEQAGFLSNLARHAVISIGNARMLEDRQYQVKVLTSLQALALRLSSTVESRAVATAILDTTVNIFEPSEATIFRFSPQGQLITHLANLRLQDDGYRSAPSLILPEVAQAAMKSGTIRTTHRDTRNELYANTLSIPLKHGSRIVDVLSLAYREPHPFPMRDQDALALLASQAAGHLENATLHEQIRSGNERMAAVLNSTRDGVIVLDQRGALVDANPAARRLLGDGMMAYVNEAVADSIWKQRDPAQRQTGMLREYTSKLKEVITRRQFELKTPKGIVYLEEIGSPVVDAQRRAVGWLLVLRDVSEERQLAEYRDEITNMVVHDLRGPLASIISGIYLAQEEVTTQPGQEFVAQTLSLSSDSANRLMVLVESLLDVAKMEAREMQLRLEVTPLDAMVDRAVSLLEATMQQARIRLERVIPGDVAASVDSDLIVRVIVNLLDNALRHTPSGETVLVGAERTADGKFVLMRIADSGRGIPAEEREQVFEKFKQAKGSKITRGKRGTGLGLTFCRLAVEAHGGRIWVEDDSPLSGASFAFTLPLVANTPVLATSNRQQA